MHPHARRFSLAALALVAFAWPITALASLRPDCSPCRATKPNGVTASGETAEGSCAHGVDGLATCLWPDGAVVFEPGGPGFVLEDGALAMKFPWTRGVKGRLTVEGRRLDAEAPPLRANVIDYGEGPGFQATVLIFPTPGCWEGGDLLIEDEASLSPRSARLTPGCRKRVAIDAQARLLEGHASSALLSKARTTRRLPLTQFS